MSLSGAPLGGRFVRLGRLGSLRAGSRVIRAHWVRRLIDEHGRARITRSPALADSAGGVIIFLDGLGVPGWLIVRSELDFGCCWREISLGVRFDVEIDFLAILPIESSH